VHAPFSPLLCRYKGWEILLECSLDTFGRYFSVLQKVRTAYILHYIMQAYVTFKHQMKRFLRFRNSLTFPPESHFQVPFKKWMCNGNFKFLIHNFMPLCFLTFWKSIEAINHFSHNPETWDALKVKCRVWEGCSKKNVPTIAEKLPHELEIIIDIFSY
jgi:hypothetical protein